MQVVLARARVFHLLEIRDFSQSKNVLSLPLLYQVDSNLMSNRRDSFDDKSEGGEWSISQVIDRVLSCQIRRKNLHC